MMDMDSDPGPRLDPALGEEDTIKGLLRDYEATTRTVPAERRGERKRYGGVCVCVCVCVGAFPLDGMAPVPSAASEAYCCELKQQLHEALDAVEQLREKLAQSERDLCSARELQSKQREEVAPVITSIINISPLLMLCRAAVVMSQSF